MKRLILYLWAMWDVIYYHCNRMQFVSRDENLFRVVLKRHHGPPLPAGDGEWIYPGDKILKIHLYNYRIAKEIRSFPSEMAYIFFFKRALESSLQGLSTYIHNLPERQEIKGIVGTSMFNRGAERLGFTVYDVEETILIKLKGVLYKLIYWLIHPQGWAYLRRHGKRLKPKHLIMSVDELHRRYAGLDHGLPAFSQLDPTGTKT